MSLCALTNAAPPQAIAFLQAWRPHVDEIVVAVDERAHPDTAAACRTCADRVFVVPAAGYLERYLGWLLSQCSGDWVLRMDDDELPSTALVEMLPDLLASRHHTHYWLPGRWVYPTAERYLACGVWLRDIHPRLVRNLPGLWRTSGRLHSDVMALGSTRIVEAPFLHLTTLIDDAAARRAKVAAYARHAPANQFAADDRTAAYYLPEDGKGIVTEALVTSDAARIRSFLATAAQTVSASTSTRPEPDVDVRALDAWSDEVLGSEDAIGARVRIVYPLEPMPAGGTAHVQVEVSNQGEDVWPGGSSSWPLIRIGHRWQHADGRLLDLATARAYFTERVFPGTTTRLLVTIQAPLEPGTHTVLIDVVNEFVRWFDAPARQAVEIRAADEPLPGTQPVAGQPLDRRSTTDGAGSPPGRARAAPGRAHFGHRGRAAPWNGYPHPTPHL